MIKTRVRRAFDGAAADYAAAADLQRRVAEGLFARLPPGLAPDRVVDAGCGTGFAATLCAERWPQAAIVGVDFAAAMLGQLPPGLAARVCGDIERLPLASASTDLAWSSLCLQWCELPRALAELARVLRPDGTLAFATLAGDTFHELRAAFSGIDGHAHTLDFLSPEAIAAAVAGAGLDAIAIERERIEASFADLPSLLRSIRRVGAGEVAGERRRGLLGRQAWRGIEARYAGFCRDGRWPLTYDVLYVTARA